MEPEASAALVDGLGGAGRVYRQAVYGVCVEGGEQAGAQKKALAWAGYRPLRVVG